MKFKLTDKVIINRTGEYKNKPGKIINIFAPYPAPYCVRLTEDVGGGSWFFENELTLDFNSNIGVEEIKESKLLKWLKR